MFFSARGILQEVGLEGGEVQARKAFVRGVLAGGAVERLHFHSLSRGSAPSWRPRGRAVGIPVLAVLEGEGLEAPCRSSLAERAQTQEPLVGLFLSFTFLTKVIIRLFISKS